MDPKSREAFVAHGVGYYYLPVNFGGGPENAIKDFKQALALDPKSPRPVCGWGSREASITRTRRPAKH